MINPDLLGLAHPVSSLSTLPGNPRRGDVEAVAASLKRFGQRKPIVARASDRVVIAGNHTLQAAVSLGWDEVAVSFVDENEEESLAFALADNRTAELGDYDDGLLLDLIRSVGDFDPELLLDTGWSPEAVAELVARIDPGLPDVPPSDDAPEPPVKPFSKLGDVWVLGEHRVACGDSTDVGVHDALLGSDVPDMVLTDPPYGMHLTADWSSIKGSLKSIGAGKTSGNKYDDVIGDHEDFDPQPYLGMYDRVKEQFWFGADYYAERIPSKNDGSWLVWDKRKDSQADAIGAEFELCWSRQKHKRRMLRHDWFGFLASGTNARDARNRVHPTQKPVSLFVDIMDQWGKHHDAVLDPFGGSGSTLMACEYTGRKARLIELDPRYVDVICRRWQEHTGAKPVLESTGAPHDFTGGSDAESS